jgi:signal transduction histidine kinase
VPIPALLPARTFLNEALRCKPEASAIFKRGDWNLDKNRRRALLSWLFVGVLAILSACFGILQYHWLGKVSRAERDALRGSLQVGLQRLSQDFNAEVSADCSALVPQHLNLNPSDRESEYTERFLRLRDSGGYHHLIKGLFRVVPQAGSLGLRKLNPTARSFTTVDWPRDWAEVNQGLSARLFSNDRPLHGPPRGTDQVPDLIVIPRFGGPGPMGETEWVLIQVDLDFIRTTVIPELLQRDLGAQAASDYQTEITMNDDPSTLIYTSGPASRDKSAKAVDAAIRLFDAQVEPPARFGEVRERRHGPREAMMSDRGRWTLSLRHRAGSLEAVVAQARWRNLAMALGLFLLLVAAVAALVLFSRRAQRLAEIQMEFVAGVSHELRTPLSVMRTAGHNLRGSMAHDPVRVQRYGALIEDESEKLTAIVEQVLRFANAKAGRVVGTSEPVFIEGLIDEAIRADRKAIEQSGCVLERKIEAELPPVLGDSTALKHALQNLLSNAAKYGKVGQWIGVSASLEQEAPGAPAVEIRIADHGPGIPPSELGHIFDAFYRGKKAIEDQVHGTGLGLSLVKRIIEAHHGSIAVRSEAGKGTEFIVHLPTATLEQEHDLANSVG